MIEIKNLNISFGDKVILNNASFHTSPGVLTIIRGKSGSGKSTFLKAFQFAYECEYIYEGQRIDEQVKIVDNSSFMIIWSMYLRFLCLLNE